MLGLVKIASILNGAACPILTIFLINVININGTLKEYVVEILCLPVFTRVIFNVDLT